MIIRAGLIVELLDGIKRSIFRDARRPLGLHTLPRAVGHFDAIKEAAATLLFIGNRFEARYRLTITIFCLSGLFRRTEVILSLFLVHRIGGRLNIVISGFGNHHARFLGRGHGLIRLTRVLGLGRRDAILREEVRLAAEVCLQALLLLVLVELTQEHGIK